MNYRIYLETQDGSKFERTETGSRSIAAPAFEELVKRDDLEKTPVSVCLVFQRTTLAIHQLARQRVRKTTARAILTRSPGRRELGRLANLRNSMEGAPERVSWCCQSDACCEAGKGQS